MAELKARLKDYDDLVMREYQMLKVRYPSKKDHRSYFNFMWNQKPLCEEEDQFIYPEDAMLYLSTDAEAAWMESAFDAIITIFPKKILKVCPPVQALVHH